MLRRSLIATVLIAGLLAISGIPASSASSNGISVGISNGISAGTSNSVNAGSMSIQTSFAMTAPTVLSRKATVVKFPGARPFNLQVPSIYSKSKPSPLIIALHGYSSSGAELEKFLQLAPVANARGILYVAPDGSLDNNGLQFWKATPACCDFYGSKVDDGAYIMSIINTISKRYNVDQKRIYVVGHSNGGFMAHHMACADSNRIAAIASFAGATYKVQSMCKPGQPITVLQIWGTADETISYLGGTLLLPYPGAGETIADWAKLNKCIMKLIPTNSKINVDNTIPGAETTVSDYFGCAKNTSVELWSVAGGHHVPTLAPDFATRLVNFLLAHPKG